MSFAASTSVPDGARPVQSVHDAYGVLPGLPPTYRKCRPTLTLESIFSPKNDPLFLNIGDRVAREGAVFDFPRKYERTMWPAIGVCVSEQAPAEVTLLPLANRRVPAGLPLTDDGIYCVGTRPIPLDGGAPRWCRRGRHAAAAGHGDAGVRSPGRALADHLPDRPRPGDPRARPLRGRHPEGRMTYPDISSGRGVPVPFQARRPSISRRTGRRSARRPTSASCRQPSWPRPSRSWSRRCPACTSRFTCCISTTWTRRCRCSSDDLAAVVVRPRWADFAAKLPDGTFSWLFNPPGAALPLTAVQWWAFWIWETAGRNIRDEAGPTTRTTTCPGPPRNTIETSRSLLLSPEETATYEGKLIKICDASPGAQPFGQLPFPHNIYEPSWTITAADPPSYLVQLKEHRVVRAIDFVEQKRDRELPDLHPLLRRVTGT